MKTPLIFVLFASVSLAACASQLLDVIPGETANAKTTNPKSLLEECQRIEEVYPLLMMAVMLEGPMICGDPNSGDEEIRCDEYDTAEEKAQRAHRLEVRKMQESAAKNADIACDLYEQDVANLSLEKAARDAVAASRSTDDGRLKVIPN